MKTKADFQAAIAAEISNYPAAAERYRARDPSMLASLDAMAAMLALQSAEQDVAAAEPFTKSRDATVLADASAKGVLPFGLPSELVIQVTNSNTAPYQIQTGRRLLDSQGRSYLVVAGITIAAGVTAPVRIKQQGDRQFDHTVTVTQPFYQIEVPSPAEGKTIAAVRVIGPGNVEFAWKPEYVNVLAGDKSFHLATDESRRLLIEFGADGLAGYAAQAGETFTIIVTDTEGAVEVAPASRFAFEYSSSVAEGQIVMVMDEVLSAGRGALDIPTLRTMSDYPSLYDTSAVYLGNFDFLVRRNLSPFRFLSVWNEQTEEVVRGPNVDNINTLFVAAMKDGVADAALRAQIKAVILKADDSYKVKDVTVVEVPIPLTVAARVHSVYDFEQVRQQIREQILGTYGRDSAFAKSGQNRILYRSVYDLLSRNVPALQGVRADIQVEVDDLATNIPPEHYRFVSEASLTVTVDQVL